MSLFLALLSITTGVAGVYLRLKTQRALADAETSGKTTQEPDMPFTSYKRNLDHPRDRPAAMDRADHLVIVSVISLLLAVVIETVYRFLGRPW